MSNPPNDQGNPAWKPLLDKLPEELHGMVKPVLEQWDQNFQQQVQSVKDEYKGLEDYKTFADQNVDPKWLETAAMLVAEMQAKPEETIKRIVTEWDLDFVAKSEASNQPPNDPDPYDDPDDSTFDITKHPEFKKLQEQLQTVEQGLQTKEQREEQERQIEEFESALDDLEEKYKDDGGINRTLVTAFASQGLSLEDAVTEYRKLVGHAGSSNQPPANESDTEAPSVMGGDGTTGSGVPTEPIDYGKMSKDDLDKHVQNLLNQASNQ